MSEGYAQWGGAFAGERSQARHLDLIDDANDLCNRRIARMISKLKRPHVGCRSGIRRQFVAQIRLASVRSKDRNSVRSMVRTLSPLSKNDSSGPSVETGRFNMLGVLAGLLLLACEPLAAVAGPPDPNSGLESSVGAIREAIAEKLRLGLSEVPAAVISVKAFGAAGDGSTDDAPAIERAIRSIQVGGIVVFPSGIYVQSRSIYVTAPNVILWGAGARLHGSNPMDHAVAISGERSSIIGFELTAETKARGVQVQQMRVVLGGRGNQAIENDVNGAGAVGIAALGATNFRILQNRVRNTLADGIHMTSAARHGVVAHNVVVASQDDLISVVSYGKGEMARDILIADNDVRGNPWGRGITVVGGRDVTIRNNVIRDVSGGAGIYVAREQYYRTNGVFNVLVEHNVLEHIQTKGSVLDARPPNFQAAFEIIADDQGDPDLNVRDVLFRGNEVRDALADGVRLIGGVCEVGLVDNHFEKLGGQLIRLAKVGCGLNALSCKGTTLNGVPASPAECGSFNVNVTGASVTEE